MGPDQIGETSRSLGQLGCVAEKTRAEIEAALQSVPNQKVGQTLVINWIHHANTLSDSRNSGRAIY